MPARIQAIRVQRRGHWTTIPNETLRDERLKADALGVLVWLLSHADGFMVSVASIRARFGFGRDKAWRILRELEDAGYIARVQERDEKGRFVWRMLVSDRPFSSYEETMHGFSVHGKTVHGKHGHLRNTSIKKDQSEEDVPAADAAGTTSEPDGSEDGARVSRDARDSRRKDGTIPAQALRTVVSAWAVLTGRAVPGEPVPRGVYPRLAREAKRALEARRARMAGAAWDAVAEALVADLRAVWRWTQARAWETPPSDAQVHDLLARHWAGTLRPQKPPRAPAPRQPVLTAAEIADLGI